MVRIVGMACADVAEGIDHALVGEDAVGGDDLFEDGFKLGHWGFLVGGFVARMERSVIRGQTVVVAFK